MQYKDADQYKKAMKESGKFRKANDYEVFAWNICLECQRFKADKKFPTQGVCLLMEKEGAYGGVIATAVCNQYLNKRGYDINGKVVNPALLPACIKTRKTKAGEIFIVES
jgi:hypothetical protein